jgi:enediyne core biosynthesis thioesterase
VTRSYEFRHIVSFAETNLVGNVYYVHLIAWQGRCRELFLRDHAPEILGELAGDLSLATTRCSCVYYSELKAFDEVIVRMHIAEQVQNRVTMGFEYHRIGGGVEELVARGEQEIVTLRRDGSRLLPTPLPASLKSALDRFR